METANVTHWKFWVKTILGKIILSITANTQLAAIFRQPQRPWLAHSGVFDQRKTCTPQEGGPPGVGRIPLQKGGLYRGEFQGVS